VEGGFVQRLTFAVAAALAAALAVVSLSAAAQQQTRALHEQARHRFPHRIVSLSPTVTEDLFAIGAGKQVVAVDQDSNYPKRAPHTSLSGFTPNVEAIANYHPDLVLISYDPGNFASQLRKLGIKVVNEAAANNLGQAYREILQLGGLTGHDRGATAVVHSMRTQLAALVRSVPKSRRHLRVYHELDPTYYSATSKTFIGSVYKLFGFRDIADAAAGTGGGYPQLSAEYIIAQNPQIIVLADTKCCGQDYATVAARPGWSAIAAVQHHRVVRADDDVASRWGPRIVQFARSVARIAKQG
jgi:iron complex transport system substrate-binding protein